jgi:amidase
LKTEQSITENIEYRLAQIRKWNPVVNAIVSMRDENDILNEALLKEKQPNNSRGALHGEIIAVKDLANAKGFPTTQGSPIFANKIAIHDDLIVARMRAAGAIIIGKTNTPELGLGSNTFNSVFGITKNPYNLSKSAGGSSGGAAVALACDMVKYADGSDMMGSLRNPAAWNNVYGMRPTWGLVPSEPMDDLYLHKLSTSGPMAKDPNNLAILLRVLAGKDKRQPNGVPFFDINVPLRARSLKNKRIISFMRWDLPFEDETKDLTEQALKKFEELGAFVEVIDLPMPMEKVWEAWITLRSWSISNSLSEEFQDPIKRKLMKKPLIWEIMRGQSLNIEEIVEASKIRSEWFKEMALLLDKYDAAVLPSTQVQPFNIEEEYPEFISNKRMDTYHRWMEVVVPASLIGLPAINLPAGFCKNGLPFGIQLIGKQFSDNNLLNIAESWHRATLLPEKYPPIFAN